MSIRLVCNHCGGSDQALYELRLASLHNGAVYDNPYSAPATHLHWECIPDWVAHENAERARNVEVPF